MADKIAYVGRVDKANASFMERYRAHGNDLTVLPEDNGKRNNLDASPLYRIYESGAAEIAKRFANGQSERLLSAQSIAAIRSALDGVQVRQVQKLNRSMVLLTIAIAGGPFIGLLGTVLGVMITFATIAASGNVDINAIAPGISAASSMSWRPGWRRSTARPLSLLQRARAERHATATRRQQAV
jgi:biopolymer transport protein ExbB